MTDRSESSRDLVAFGLVLKPHGIRGELRVRLLCDGEDHFSACTAGGKILLWRDPPAGGARRFSSGSLEPASYEIETLRYHAGHALIKFLGIDSMTESERLRGGLIGLPQEQLPDSDNESYYLFDLEGLDVVPLPGDDAIGIVESVQEYPGHDQMRVRPTDASLKPFLIPFVQAIVEKVDLDAGRIYVRLPEGLVESQQ
jgi:16S rRNA processing protein RimM